MSGWQKGVQTQKRSECKVERIWLQQGKQSFFENNQDKFFVSVNFDYQCKGLFPFINKQNLMKRTNSFTWAGEWVRHQRIGY